jgi:hypothetical protein
VDAAVQAAWPRKLKIKLTVTHGGEAWRRDAVAGHGEAMYGA